ncbi:MAG: hypothetical protein KAI83_01880 [Thiomargarita sp.]|nr:hypothetical protein [Thiomargarita sp.]
MNLLLTDVTQSCRVGNVVAHHTTFLMRKVGNKRTLPTLPLLRSLTETKPDMSDLADANK